MAHERVALAAAAVAAAGLAAGGLAYASLWPTSSLFGRAVVAGSDPAEVALTFDDGPNPAATPHLLEMLARHGVRATFFVIGRFALERPELVRAVAAGGHLVANHTMSHPKLSVTPLARVRTELARCTEVLEDLVGAPMRYFRPPFGARRPAVLRAARELGLTPVLWNVTGYDWNAPGAEAIVGRLEAGIAGNRRRGRGSNLLLHDGGHLGLGAPRLGTVEATRRLIEAHRGDGTRFVTVDAWG